jgi:hypothetical protein
MGETYGSNQSTSAGMGERDHLSERFEPGARKEFRPAPGMSIWPERYRSKYSPNPQSYCTTAD